MRANYATHKISACDNKTVKINRMRLSQYRVMCKMKCNKKLHVLPHSMRHQLSDKPCLLKPVGSVHTVPPIARPDPTQALSLVQHAFNL